MPADPSAPPIVPGVPSQGLPVEAALPELRAAMAGAGIAVLQAPPGAGKTTLVPLALAAEPWATGTAARTPSTLFCLLMKFFTMRLTKKQMDGLLRHPDSPWKLLWDLIWT